jgi:hypothetical protein
MSPAVGLSSFQKCASLVIFAVASVTLMKLKFSRVESWFATLAERKDRLQPEPYFMASKK